MSAFISLTLAALLAAPAAPDTQPRFALTGTLNTAPARSADARFELQASARMDGGNPATPGAGRFALKSANGVTACSAGNDIFRNGFE
jgi:hypothetical protein